MCCHSSLLAGVRTASLRAAARPSDGVRGLFTTRFVHQGGMLLEVPRRYCYFPRGLGSPTLPVPDDTRALSRYCAELKRLNRTATLLPEVWLWMQRFSPDVKENGVSLTAHVSVSDPDTGTPANGRSVVSITLTAVEAALAVSTALRFFYAHAAHLDPRARLSLAIGAGPMATADAFVDSLPFAQFLAFGVEDLFATSGDHAESHAHSGLAQLACNLRDAVLTYATPAEYNLLDSQSELFDEIVLIAVYIVRARCLPVRRLGNHLGASADSVVTVFAPGLDHLNHGGKGRTAEAAAYGGGVVVRATRDMRAGEEVTLHYGFSLANQLPSMGPAGHPPSHPLSADNWQEGRYMLNMDDEGF